MRRFALAASLYLALGCAGARSVAGGAGRGVSSAAGGGASTSTTRVIPREPDAAACVQAARIEPGQTVRGTTTGRRDLFHATCAFGAGSADAVYTFHLDSPARVRFAVASSYDSAVYLRSSCRDGDTEIACNDDTGDELHAQIAAALPPGDYFVFVDGFESGNAGFYSLSMEAAPIASQPRLSPISRVAAGTGVIAAPNDHGAGVSGTVTFAKRHFTPRGLTRDTTRETAPRFVVEALDRAGAIVATGETDDRGEFRLAVPAGRDVSVRVSTRTTYLGNDIRVVSDPGTEQPYRLETRTFRVTGGERFQFFAGVGDVEPAGAFNILAQFVRYLAYIDRAFHHPLPPLFAFWRRGNNRSLPQGTITAFLSSYHRHAGSFALQIQGGDPNGREDMSDADQFDDPVIMHEFSHFVIHTMAGHFSTGGIHQNGELHFPGQALDEGAATALGNAVLGDPRYWDTAGLEPSGSILVDENTENMMLPDRGIGSQNSAQVILWDLMDGAEGLADTDNDGIAIGISGVLRIYASFHDDGVSFPGIHTILDRGVELSLLTAAQASRIVHAPTEHGFVHPLPAAQSWPFDLSLPSETTGLIDGRSQPAPSGGRNIPSNGFDSMRTYRLRVAQRGWLSIDLEIDGTGRQPEGSDLDLWLTTRNLETVARSSTQSNVERIHRVVEPGTYMVIVRDADVSTFAYRLGTQGNRANFRLRVRLSVSP